MKYTIIIALFIFSFIIAASFSLACEPCAYELSIEETAIKSDLIIVGQKIEDGPRSDFEKGFGGPDWIKVKVLQVINGTTPEPIIMVNSWDGMCSYGIIIEDDREYVMFLQKRDVVDGEILYDAVEYGCGVKLFPVSNHKDNLRLDSGLNDENSIYESIFPAIIVLSFLIVLVFLVRRV